MLSSQKSREMHFVKLFHNFQAIFSKDSQDCGVTDLHTVKIPTDPKAPLTIICQYRIPLATYESIQESLTICSKSKSSGTAIRHITRSSGLYGSKPGKWHLTLDYCPLNKQVPLSPWPMIHLDQELAKVKGACFFSTVDVASGFWTMRVGAANQYKLAFSFGNHQYI